MTATATGVGIGGVYGLRALTQPVRAQTTLTFEDNTIVLEEDEEISSVTILGTIEISYDVGDNEADTAGLRVTIANTDGLVSNDVQTFEYDSIDADSDTITEEIESTVNLPDEVIDPDPGAANETEFIVDTVFGVNRAKPGRGNNVIIEDRANDTAVLRIEREAADDGDDGDDEDDDEDGDDDDSDRPESNISGSFSFEVETD